MRSSSSSTFVARSGAVTLLCLSHLASADSWVALRADTPYEVSWVPAGGPKVTVSARVDRAGRYPLSTWFRVAPDERAVAFCGHDEGLIVRAASGAPIFARPGAAGAFAFSPDGARFAFASTAGIELLRLDSPAPRPGVIAHLAGVDLLRFADRGLVARAGGRLLLIEKSGEIRTLARATRMEAVAVAGGHAVFFSGGTMTRIALVGGTAPEKLRLHDRTEVLDAELSPKGDDLVWMTAERVYRRAGAGPVRVVATVRGVATLRWAPDGSSWLWSSYDAGTLVTGAGPRQFPGGLGRGAFRGGGQGIVGVRRDQVVVWDPVTDRQTAFGSVDGAETSLWSAEMIGRDLVTLTARTPPGFKEHAAPSSLP